VFNNARRGANMAEAIPLPETGFLRLSQIVGNPDADPPIPAVIPIGRSSWWEGVRTGRYPQPIKLGPRTTCWRVEDIRALIERMRGGDHA
jgi:prophage regulatory protein